MQKRMPNTQPAVRKIRGLWQQQGELQITVKGNSENNTASSPSALKGATAPAMCGAFPCRWQELTRRRLHLLQREKHPNHWHP